MPILTFLLFWQIFCFLFCQSFHPLLLLWAQFPGKWKKGGKGKEKQSKKIKEGNGQTELTLPGNPPPVSSGIEEGTRRKAEKWRGRKRKRGCPPPLSPGYGEGREERRKRRRRIQVVERKGGKAKIEKVPPLSSFLFSLFSLLFPSPTPHFPLFFPRNSPTRNEGSSAESPNSRFGHTKKCGELFVDSSIHLCRICLSALSVCLAVRSSYFLAYFLPPPP